ncbi:PIN domain-containing protein [Falsibacillus pallidus]|uniref:PIN domain-containing protein n=1 Tax=Falsibacillus pallidus TaxID=493781 RepID=A0A370G5C3_9BACI|nr:PIN domain-containing protein [Falsibacillus pallidus]RDI37253.1 PIN domain-containing protein [Falsibacillus pallidus]
MTIHYLEDYCVPGRDYSEDAFFMDTNYLIAFINPSHSYHLSTVIHTLYLIQQKAKLFINEIFLSEAVDVLARGIYTEEQFEDWLNSQKHRDWLSHHTPSRHEYNNKKDEIRGTFIAKVVKNHKNPKLLRYYNKKSIKHLEDLILSRLFNLTAPAFSSLETGLNFAKSIPLQSNDAFIAGAAAMNAANLLTFDNDFKKVTIIAPNTGKEVTLFTMKFTNNYLFNKRSHTIINSLDQSLKKVIVQAVGGQEQFLKKFGKH